MLNRETWKMKTQIMKFLIMITISVIAALATFSTSGHAQILKGRVVAYSAGEPTLVLKEWEVTVDTTATYVPYTLPSFLSVVITGHFGNYELYTHRVSQELGLEHQDSYNFSVKVDPNMQDGDIVRKEYYYYNLASTKPILAPSTPDTQPITVTQTPDTQPIPAPNNPTNPGNPITPTLPPVTNKPTVPSAPDVPSSPSNSVVPNSPMKTDAPATVTEEEQEPTENLPESNNQIDSNGNLRDTTQLGVVSNNVLVGTNNQIQQEGVELPETAAESKFSYGILFVLTTAISLIGICLKARN